MRTTWFSLVFGVLCCASNAASLEKAQMLYQHNLPEDAKKELIDVIYSDRSSPATKASALYMLGDIDSQQGNIDAAKSAIADLLQKYPNSPEAIKVKSRAQQATATLPPAVPNDTAPNRIQLISQGTEPRFQLRYSLRGKEERAFMLRAAMLDSDCPSKPSKERYPSADMDIRLTATPLMDSTNELLHVALGMSVSGSAPGKDGTLEHMDPEHVDMSVRMRPSGEVLDDLPAELKKFGGMQSFGGQFPAESLGLGARWEVSAPADVEGHPTDMNVTYIVTSISATDAQLHIVAEFKGAFVEADQGVRIEGRGEGETHWAAGHLVANDMSLTSFIRMLGTQDGKDVPGQAACILLTMGPKASHGVQITTANAVSPQPRPQPEAARDDAIALVDAEYLGRYWKPVLSSQTPPDIGGIESSYCVAVGFTIGKDGIAANPYPLYVHADGVSDGLKEKAKQSFQSYVQTLRFAPVTDERTPVFTYGVFGRYNYRSESSNARKQRAESNERGWCEDAAKRSMAALRAKAK